MPTPPSPAFFMAVIDFHTKPATEKLLYNNKPVFNYRYSLEDNEHEPVYCSGTWRSISSWMRFNENLTGLLCVTKTSVTYLT